MRKILILINFIVLIGCKKSEDGTVEVVPLAPTELKAAVISKDQINLTWKDNSTNETGYKIERKTDAGIFTEIGSTATDITTSADKTVSLNTNYIYRIYSFNKVGKSIQYSNEVSIKTLNVATLTTTAITEITENGAKSGGNVSFDGGSTITTRGVVWGTSSNSTIALGTKTSDGTGLGLFQSSITGLKANTKYYARAYSTNSAGTSYGNEVSFTTAIAFTFNTVIGANGRIWMDRNLGAKNVAKSSKDAESYGDLYQWGRGSDGHQLRNSATTSDRSVTDNPGHAKFINNHNDWRINQNDNLWQGVNGINNPCPTGFRLPTDAEWVQELNSWKSQGAEGAFTSPLKIPMAGQRQKSGGINGEGIFGQYWSSNFSYRYGHFISLHEWGTAGLVSTNRSEGGPCRCIKN